jgi:NADH:ubiquinone oxidoreductase subunit 3 (subunit A)
MKNKLKPIIRFFFIAVISFFVFEVIEHLLLDIFNISIESLELGWFTFIIIYGFKFHILCCVVPMIWAAYKCKHSCDHDHCEKNQNEK